MTSGVTPGIASQLNLSLASPHLTCCRLPGAMVLPVFRLLRRLPDWAESGPPSTWKFLSFSPAPGPVLRELWLSGALGPVSTAGHTQLGAGRSLPSPDATPSSNPHNSPSGILQTTAGCCLGPVSRPAGFVGVGTVLGARGFRTLPAWSAVSADQPWGTRHSLALGSSSSHL